MRNIKLLLLALTLLMTFPACNDFLSEVQPKDNLPITSVFQTAADLESALNGVYNILQHPAIAGLNLLFYGDLLSRNGTFTISGFPEEFDIANQTLRSSNFRVEQTWTRTYEAINLINSILNALEKIQDTSLNAGKGDRIRGECLFLRGVLHFELVKLYGIPYNIGPDQDGVPLLTKAVLESGSLTFPSRASVTAIYSQIEEDLNAAKALLPMSQPKDRANPAAAVAYLARVAFQKEDYSSVIIHTQNLFDNYGLSLTETPSDFFTNEDNSELIWAISYTPSDPNTGIDGGKAAWFHENQARVSISPALKTAFNQIITNEQKQALSDVGLQAMDLRTTADLANNFPLVSNDLNYTNKYEDTGGNSDDTPMARLAEFYLMAAEAIARTEGITPQSINLLNAIRLRALRGLDASGSEISTPVLTEIIQYKVADFMGTNGLDNFIETLAIERRVELCFEGNYLHDLVRLKKSVQDIPFSDCRLRLPIPQREIDVNTNLTQNGECY